MAQLYPRALGSRFVSSYDSRGYGGDILTRLHTGKYFCSLSDYYAVCSSTQDTEVVTLHWVTRKW
jgi:hypothetical protein